MANYSTITKVHIERLHAALRVDSALYTSPKPDIQHSLDLFATTPINFGLMICIRKKKKKRSDDQALQELAYIRVHQQTDTSMHG